MVKLRKILIVVAILFLLPSFALADEKGEPNTFFVDPSYDMENRKEVTATLKKVSDNAYFYVEEEWYKNRTEGAQEEVKSTLEVLANEFDNVIYPQLTSTFGSEWKPGIDDDEKITILFHSTRENAAGYFRSEDEYEKFQASRSNEREMIYLKVEYLRESIVKSYVAHEFTHLITFNQKNRLQGTSEKVWLNEARADYAPSLLGYDDEYYNSNLEQRVNQFTEAPSNSLVGWESEPEDYGVLNVFTQYLVDHYGKEILIDSLDSSESGIASINEALEDNNFSKSFSDIFTDWTITIFLNDCRIGEKYCYKNENLKDLKVNPSLIFIPSTKETNISTNYSLEPWSGNWYRIMGGEGNLNLKVNGENSGEFKLPYVLCESSDQCEIDFLELDSKQDSTTTLENFEQYHSLTLIPSVLSPKSGFNGEIGPSSFSIEASVKNHDNEEVIEELKAQIEELQRQIAQVKARIREIKRRRKRQEQNNSTCSSIEQNLSFGMNNEKVKCLQQFLKNQEEEIYPEGLITGYFGPLTRRAVIRFQEKYREEILKPWHLRKGTGFVGKTTRSKVNEIINQ